MAAERCTSFKHSCMQKACNPVTCKRLHFVKACAMILTVTQCGYSEMASPVLQVIIVGDLNVAASQADVHKKLNYERMYSKAEKEALQALLRDYTDVWRQLHPEVDNIFTVWDEKTSARVFNEVQRLPSHGKQLV